jgi:hypothetical protein
VYQIFYLAEHEARFSEENPKWRDDRASRTHYITAQNERTQGGMIADSAADVVLAAEEGEDSGSYEDRRKQIARPQLNYFERMYFGDFLVLASAPLARLFHTSDFASMEDAKFRDQALGEVCPRFNSRPPLSLCLSFSVTRTLKQKLITIVLFFSSLFFFPSPTLSPAVNPGVHAVARLC